MSKMKQRSRQAHDFLEAAARSTCPRCNAARTPHRICDNCGHYRGEEKIKRD